MFRRRGRARHRNARFCSDWRRRFRTACGDELRNGRGKCAFWRVATLGQSVREALQTPRASFILRPAFTGAQKPRRPDAPAKRATALLAERGDLPESDDPQLD